MRDYNDIRELWHILQKQLKTFEEIRDAKPWEQEDGDIDPIKKISNALVRTSCAVLEEEFNEVERFHFY